MRFDFSNATQMPEKSPNVEPFLFDPLASFRFLESRVIPYELEQAPHGFRYDRHLWGRGFNCAVEFGTDNTGEMMFRTTNVPTFEQPRYTTRTEPEASFGLLAEAPIPVLEEILGSMKEYLNEWSTWQARYRQDVPDWETKHGSEFESGSPKVWLRG